MVMIDKVNGADVTVMFDHPQGIAVDIEANNLTISISYNDKESFAGSYFINLQ
jgi:hypothetical protein